jgi:glycogen synthase
MRILLCSNWFFPSFGGVETISKILAEEFTRAGAAVTVVTRTPGQDMNSCYRVVRQPSTKTLRGLAKESDIIFQNMISLRTLIPFLFTGKPIIITHHSWLKRNNGTRGWENYAKLVALRACHNVATSNAIARSLPVTSIPIGNPFEAKEFEHLSDAPRDRDIVFMGRLVSDNGCDLMLQALAVLKSKRLVPTATIIGDGPEMPALKALTVQLGLEKQVEFRGSLREGRGQVVSGHRIMVIPSLWAEPFGLVALEGIASGCAIVASDQGGLPDAVGPCGLYFPNRNVKALAAQIERLLFDDELRSAMKRKGAAHLRKFQPDRVAAQYLALFHSLIKRPLGAAVDSRN